MKYIWEADDITNGVYVATMYAGTIHEAGIIHESTARDVSDDKVIFQIILVNVANGCPIHSRTGFTTGANMSDENLEEFRNSHRKVIAEQLTGRSMEPVNSARVRRWIRDVNAVGD